MGFKRAFHFLFPRTLEKRRSGFNSNIEVVRQFGHISVRVGGLEQSGPMVEKVWRDALKSRTNKRVQNILILGLGCGSILKVLKKSFSGSKIMAIEIDPAMVDIGKRYFGKDLFSGVEVVFADALKYLENDRGGYDIILIDLYFGGDIEEGIYRKSALRRIRDKLSDNGAVFFNHINDKKRRKSVRFFNERLEEVFGSVSYIDTVVNRVFVCEEIKGNY